MNSTEIDSDLPADDVQLEGGAAGDAEKKIPLKLEVQITEPSSCQRHVVVTVSREDIDRYFREAIDGLLTKAEVPGFRPGRAPRKLIESRFRDQVKDQVKGSLLMDSMAQINETEKFTAISEPSFNIDAVVLPDQGPLHYEFDIEVRPNFDMPTWQGLVLQRPVHEYTDEEVERQMARVLEQYGTQEPVDGAVEAEDFVTVNATFSVDGRALSTQKDLELRVRPQLSFRDAQIGDGLALLVGAKAGDRRQGTAKLSDGLDASLAGQTAAVEIEVLEVKRARPPEMTREFLDDLGGFSDVGELKAFLRGELEQQFGYHQQREMRKQITSVLTAGANWDLPPDMLRRQAKRELDRAVLELRSSGFSDEQIQAYANQLRNNSMASTSTALKEHFILERIAEAESIEAEPSDYEREIELIAIQSEESPRRVRARLEKRGQIDTLRNQIIERKVIGRIVSAALITDVPFNVPVQTEFASDVAVTVGGVESEIPEAKHAEGFGDTLKPKIDDR